MSMIKNLIEHIVKGLVSEPKSVSVLIHQKDDHDSVEIKVSAQDRGRVIGKEGRTIKAIRNLVEAAFASDKKVFIDLTQSPS